MQTQTTTYAPETPQASTDGVSRRTFVQLAGVAACSAMATGIMSRTALADALSPELPAGIVLEHTDVPWSEGLITLGCWGGEPITWHVIGDKDGGKLCLAEKVIDYMPYHNAGGDVTWEKCSLRRWLNNDFFERAFSKGERALISRVTLGNASNVLTGAESANETIDRVFVLSLQEIKNYLGVVPGKNDTSLAASVTKAAKKKGVNAYDSAGGAMWWLRSPSEKSRLSAHVYSRGCVYAYGYHKSIGIIGVRPSIVLRSL